MDLSEMKKYRTGLRQQPRSLPQPPLTESRSLGTGARTTTPNVTHPPPTYRLGGTSEIQLRTRIVHGTTIEILRTIFPSIISMFIAIQSFALLYSMDEVVVDPAITIKAIGHQWYQTYEYSDYNSSDEKSLTFDSYMILEEDLELGQSRLLEVDNRVVVPAKTHLRIIVTSADVPHSWAVPSSGVKCDVVPGRLNQISILVQREGVYYGQCSEICGNNHAFTRAPGNIGRLLSHSGSAAPPGVQATREASYYSERLEL
ncbi:hypothetical protein ARALYDRAFT_356389 [Arabidopsis lyrata subsp. lyrata]|uniref:Cytochrome c oxidase subunit 2 n=1 Tax=Arabidopsis lyrata subsp. lyrata TaxID=81972 RepID=D7MSM4_ARALL|nr:hypothetical protein ARALYDRAFT_356389 [Arabidopsis lyrata subsp. lyrata]